MTVAIPEILCGEDGSLADGKQTNGMRTAAVVFNNLTQRESKLT